MRLKQQSVIHPDSIWRDWSTQLGCERHLLLFLLIHVGIQQIKDLKTLREMGARLHFLHFLCLITWPRKRSKEYWKWTKCYWDVGSWNGSDFLIMKYEVVLTKDEKYIKGTGQNVKDSLQILWRLQTECCGECSRHLRHIILKLNHALKLHQQQLESLTIQLKRPQWRAKSYSFLQVKERGSQKQLPRKLPFREFDMPSVYEKEQCSEIYSIFKTASCWIQYLYSFLQ